MDLEDRINRLRHCTFAGEIALTVDELRSLAKLVKKDLFKSVPLPHAPERLIVAAVNCAYYYMDGGGFWEPFCQLLGVDHTIPNSQSIGSCIERALIQFGFVDAEGCGPNRYVTPIRIQAGITKRDFPTFAELLQRGRETPGLHSLHTMPQSELVSFVDHVHPAETVFTRHLKDDRSGSHLLRDAARDLLCWQRKIITKEDLCQLPGYRPGLWEELLGHLGPAPPPVHDEAPLRGHQVGFVFEPSGWCGLRFDREGVNRGEYRLDGNRVSHGFLRFENLDQYGSTFRVETSDGSSLQVSAWKPSELRPFALFHLSGEFIPHGAPVPRGECYLLAWRRVEPPQDVRTLSVFEWCQIMDFRYWQMLVEDTTDLAALGYMHGTAGAGVALQWVEHASICFLGSADGRDVFAGALPRLRVTGVQAIRENRAALCWSDGTTVRPLKISENAVNEAEVHVPAHVPCTGEVWVEPLGRQRLEAEERSEGARLCFCLLPSCTLELPSDLCAEDDEPRVVFRSADGRVRCDFRECLPLGQASGSSVWEVPASMIWLHGELTAGDDVGVRLSHRIHRARVEDDAGQTLWVSRSELATDATVRIHGWPRTQVRLCFVPPGGEQAGEVLLHQHFDDHGMVRVSCRALDDGLRSRDHAVLGVSVWGGSGWARTQARIIDLEKLERWVTGLERPIDAAWLAMLGETTCAVLRSLARVMDDARRGADEDWASDVIKELPAWLGEWASGFFACACALTPDTPVGKPWDKALSLLPASNPYRQVVEWAVQARDAIANWDDDRIAASGLVPGYDLLIWRVPCTDWDDYVRNLHKQLAGRQRLLPMLEEWKVEVTVGSHDGEPSEWSSQISRMTGGKELSGAFLRNLQSEGQQGDAGRPSWHDAYRRAKSVLEAAPTPSGLVSGLAWMLQRLVLTKYGGAPCQSEAIPAHCPKSLRPLLDGLQPHENGRRVPEDIDASLVLLEHLPLPAEDRERIHASMAPLSQAHTLTTR